jgi:hypothetical protein
MKKKELKEINKLKITEILSSVTTYGEECYSSSQEIRTHLCEYIGELIKDNDSVNINFSVKDKEDVDWKSRAHFTKIFDDEIKYCKEKYELSRNDIAFLKSLSEFLFWETNVLVDTNNKPLNQKMLADLLEVSPKTVQRNMKILESKKCIFSIPYGNETFYVVNPFLLYKGSKINMLIPALFTEMGYEQKSAKSS